MKNFLSLVGSAVGFVLVWNVLDFLFCTFIAGGDYVFSFGGDMIAPLTLTLLIQIVEMGAKKKKAVA